jgi:hypothetical protein
MKTLFLAAFLCGALTIPALASCPTTASCAEHGLAGNPTGRYKWQGTIQYAEFSHPMADGKSHLWWEKCD